MKITIFPGKYHQNGGFSMAMLVYRRTMSLFQRESCANVSLKFHVMSVSPGMIHGCMMDTPV